MNIGLIGCGGIAGAHVKAWKNHPERSQIVALADSNQGNLGDMAARVGRLPRDVGSMKDTLGMFSDYHGLLQEPSIDAVDLCLPHHLHSQVISESLLAGKHVLCEKPLCRDLDEAEQIKDALDQSGKKLMIAHNCLFEPSVRWASWMIRDGYIGKVLGVRTTDCSRRILGEHAGTWRHDPKLMGGGILIDSGYHPTYVLLHLIGEEPEHATMASSCYRMPMHAEDSAVVTYTFPSGAFGDVVASWAWESFDEDWKFCVIGERGQIRGRGNKIQIKLPGFDVQQRTLPEVDTFTEEIKHFLDYLGGGECLAGYEQSLQTLEAIRLAYAGAVVTSGGL